MLRLGPILKIDRLEVLYGQMLKSVLRIGVMTCTEFPYIELGLLLIRTRILIKRWDFWKSIAQMDNNTPLKQVIETAKHHSLKEIKHYLRLASKYSSKYEIEKEFFAITRDSRK